MTRRHTLIALATVGVTLSAAPMLAAGSTGTKELKVIDPQAETVSLAGATTTSAANVKPVTMADVASISGASSYWAAGVSGAGVDVAVIDSGVTPVPGLNYDGKVIYGPDFTADSGTAGIANLD